MEWQADAESGQENWQTLEKHWENSQAENQIV